MFEVGNFKIPDFKLEKLPEKKTPSGFVKKKTFYHHSHDDKPARVEIGLHPEVSNDYILWWYDNGVIHRDNGPAIFHKHRDSYHEYYFQNGRSIIHGPCHIMRQSDSLVASWGMIENDTHFFPKPITKHRIDGPAEITLLNNFETSYVFYINGRNISEMVFKWMRSLNIPDFEYWTEEDTLLFKMVWGN